MVPVEDRDNQIPVMLGIREAADRFGLPVHFVRELVKSRRVYAVQAGSKKYFINQASLISFLTGAGGDQI